MWRVRWMCLFFAASVILICQAITNSPTSDEAAHLVSGMAMVETGDPGFYRSILRCINLFLE